MADKATSTKNLVKDLAQLLNKNELTEIEVEQDGLRVKVVKSAAQIVAAAPMAAPMPQAPGAAATADAPAASAPAAAVSPESHPGAVKSPMVGTAYLSPEPGAPAFAAIGSTVKAGQTILIVEAMKVMNQIHAPKAGVVKEIFVSDAEPVEFDQPLMIIE